MNRKSRKALTLLEILIALSLISFLLYKGVESFFTLTNTANSQNAREQLTFAIKTARYYARSNGIKAQINMPVGSNTYTITAGTSTLTNSNYFDATSGVLPSNTLIISNNCTNLYFAVDGSLVDTSGNQLTSNCQITVGFNSGPQESFTINANSGSINNV